MKKTILLLFLGLGTAYTVQAQATLVNAVGAGISFGRMIHKKSVDKDKTAKTEGTVSTGSYQGKSFPMQRTPADQLPKKGAEQVTALETELDRCHTALLANANGAVCTPEQVAALQTAMRNLAKVNTDNMPAYQQEATFYLAENTRRQQAATPAPAAN
jgi:hypothetical protein